ncbi:MAG: mucoidy inhibitor MuiA family protein, partial [Alistipes sp.]|nr:mucoidy inhibitor MuiA family protein [Alistipes sp.]
MKTCPLCLTLALLVGATAHRAESAEKVPTSVEKVTLFLDGALVTRTGYVELPAGETTLLFTGMSPHLDARSLLVQSNDRYDRVIILDVECLYGNTGTLTRAERLQSERKLREAIRERDRNREGQRAAKAEIYRLAEEWYENDQSIKNSPEQKRELFDRYGERLHEQMARRDQLEKRVPELEERRDRLAREFGRAARQAERPITGIRVKVRTYDPCKTTLLLSYYLREAGWRPRYEVRSEGLDEPVLLLYKAEIRQQTGEEWRDAALTLSTSRPILDDTNLDLQPYRLDPDLAPPEYQLHALYNTVSGVVYEDGTRRPIAGATVQGSGSTIRTTSDRDGRFTIAMPRGSTILQFKADGMVPEEYRYPEPTINIELVPATSETPGWRMSEYYEEYFGEPQPEVFSSKPHYERKIPRPCTVPPDGNPVSVEIDSHELPAAYRHRSTPKIDPDAFLQDETTGCTQLDLPEGEAELYFENTRMGSCRLV